MKDQKNKRCRFIFTGTFAQVKLALLSLHWLQRHVVLHRTTLLHIGTSCASQIIVSTGKNDLDKKKLLSLVKFLNLKS